MTPPVATDESLGVGRKPAKRKHRAGRARAGRWVVIDESDKVDTDGLLFQLLRHYAELAGEHREVWQDRVMEADGASPRELSRVHGELIARGWVEQNTGSTPVVKRGVAAACYRVTTHGLRAYRQATVSNLNDR